MSQAPSPQMLTDRADILARDVSVASQAVAGSAEQLIAVDVPCRILQTNTSRLATLLGMQATSTYAVWMLETPELFEGYVVRIQVAGKQYRYIVKTVAKQPVPHAFTFQVADCALDLAASERVA